MRYWGGILREGSEARRGGMSAGSVGEEKLLMVSDYLLCYDMFLRSL